MGRGARHRSSAATRCAPDRYRGRRGPAGKDLLGLCRRGQIVVCLHVAGIDKDRLDVAAAIFGLSPVQKQIAALVVEGQSLREIAEVLAITQNTARTHLNRVFEKTGVRTQPALVRVLLSSAPPV